MKNNDVYILEDRGLLYLNGEDVKEFLQNIITNNIEKVTDKMSCFAALLSPQGKYLYDFIIIKHKSGYFLDCEKQNIDELYKQLNLYKLRSKVEILNLSNEFLVAGLSKEKFLSMDHSKDIQGFTIKFREDSIFLDPRSKELGARLIINLEKLHLSLKKLELKISNTEDYYNLSHNLGIPQIDTKNLQNKIFGIECNFEELNGIDFKKGCYVGQENTARIKLKEKLKKRLFAIKILEGKINAEEITYEDKEIGKLLINNQNPFALIKFQSENFNFEDNLKCGEAKIKVIKPKWLKLS
ncbi:folate-binding protein [Candidatus Pelagibacter sp.]|nr:folate-binding protein [Candidatus Pelagibacter sp.]